MNHSIRAFLTLALAGCLSVPAAFAGDSGGKSDQKSRASQSAKDGSKKTDEDQIPEVSLLEAAHSARLPRPPKAVTTDA